MQLFDSEPTNHITDEQFEKEFIPALRHLPQFIMDCSRPPMPVSDFEACYKLQMGLGERIGETLAHIPEDFDIIHKIATIRQSKTGKGKPQKTTIRPNMISWLIKFLESKPKGKKLFKTTRSTIWRYGKDACTFAGLNIYEEQDNRQIVGFWTHCLRKSCAKNMRALGASIELVGLKLRHKMSGGKGGMITFTYTKPDIPTLQKWELEHYA